MLSRVDRYMEFIMGVELLFTKLQVVNKHLVFEPVNPRNMPLINLRILFSVTQKWEYTLGFQEGKSPLK